MKQNETKYETSSSHRKIQSFHHEETLLLPRRDTKMAKKILIKSQSNLLVAQPWRSPGKGYIILFQFEKAFMQKYSWELQTRFAEPRNDWTMDDSLNDLPEKPRKKTKNKKKRKAIDGHRMTWRPPDGSPGWSSPSASPWHVRPPGYKSSEVSLQLVLDTHIIKSYSSSLYIFKYL